MEVTPRLNGVHNDRMQNGNILYNWQGYYCCGLYCFDFFDQSEQMKDFWC